MTDDIVRRLREDFITNGQCDYCEQWEWRGHFPACPYQSAADEIERWRHIAKELYTWLQPSPEDDSVYEAGIEAMAMYDEAIHDK